MPDEGTFIDPSPQNVCYSNSVSHMTGNMKLKHKKLNILAKMFKREPVIPKTAILVPTAETVKKAWTVEVVSRITRIAAVLVAIYATIAVVVEIFHPAPLKAVLSFSFFFIATCVGLGATSEKVREMLLSVDMEKFYRTLLQREAKILNPDGSLSPTVADKWTITRHYISPSVFTSFQDLDIYYDEDHERSRFAYAEQEKGAE